MKQIPITDLKLDVQLEERIFDECGHLLFNIGDTITEDTFEMLKESKIGFVLLKEPGDDLSLFRENAVYNKIPLKELKAGDKLDTDVYAKSEGKLLAAAGTVCSQNLINGFQRRGIETLYFRKPEYAAKKKKYVTFCDLKDEALREEIALPEVEIKEPEMYDEVPDLSPDLLDKDSDVQTKFVKPEGDALSETVKRPDPVKKKSEKEKKAYQGVLDEFIETTKLIFGLMAKNNRVETAAVGSMAKSALAALINDRDLMINLSNFKSPMDEYLVGHTINVTILSINIGTALGYSQDQIYELAYGAFLHDIGMVTIPNDILLCKRKLTPQESLEVKKHTIYGINCLSKMRHIPMSTPYVVYHSHERENGKGYPKGRKGMFIHPFAKIIAVADVYDALTSERPHRQAFIPYQALEQVIFLGGQKFLDPKSIRGLLKYFSLFPIGSYVQLNSGDIAKVVAANEKEFTKPTVSLIYTAQGKALNCDRIDLSVAEEYKVDKAIDGRKFNLGLLDGF